MQIGRWPETYRARGVEIARVGSNHGPHASSAAAQTPNRLVISHEEILTFPIGQILTFKVMLRQSNLQGICLGLDLPGPSPFGTKLRPSQEKHRRWETVPIAWASIAELDRASQISEGRMHPWLW